jgi:hypothetical protein
MGVSGQRHAPTALYPRVITPSTHCTGGWVGPRAGVDTEARGKILCFCRGSNHGRPVCSQTPHWLRIGIQNKIKCLLATSVAGGPPAPHYLIRKTGRVDVTTLQNNMANRSNNVHYWNINCTLVYFSNKWWLFAGTDLCYRPAVVQIRNLIIRSDTETAVGIPCSFVERSVLCFYVVMLM